MKVSRQLRAGHQSASAPTAAHRRRSAGRRRRGSVLVFVVVALVLMMLLGATYLQMARVERLAFRPHENNIDTVAAAVIDQIATVLAEDLHDANGDFFKPGTDTEPGDEPYDYPWTNRDRPGHLDDMWLASLVPSGSSLNDAKWPHITNLNIGPFEDDAPAGFFLEVVEGARDPIKYLVKNDPGSSNSAEFTRDTDVPLDLKGLVDTDADDIGDSRWSEATIAQIGPVRYVMAVRIIDLGAMINLNTASALTDDGVRFNSDSPRWNDVRPLGDTPAEVDVSRLLAYFDPTQRWYGNLTGEQRFLAHRGLSSSIPTPNYNALGQFAPDGRSAHWFSMGRLYGKAQNLLTGNFRRFDLEEEMELRYDSRFDSTLELVLPSALEEREEPGTALPGEVSIRHLLTTISGTTVLAANHADIHNGHLPQNRDDFRGHKFDLLYGVDDPDYRIGQLKQRLAAVFEIEDGEGSAYLGLSPDHPMLDRIATEFALAIQDYTDTDSVPNTAKSGGVTYAGLEPMPFLREIYLQGLYVHKLQDPQPPDSPKPVYDRFDLELDSTALAVEIANPFDQQVNLALTDGDVRVQLVVVQDHVDQFSVLLTGGLPPRDPDPAGSGHEPMIVYTEPAVDMPEDYLNEAGKTMGRSLVQDLKLRGRNVVSTDRLRSASTKQALAVPAVDRVRPTDQVTVELRVRVDTGEWITYDRLTANGFFLASSIDHQEQDPTVQVSPRHGQMAVRRDGRDAHFVSNRGKTFVWRDIRQVTDPSTGAYQLDIEELEKDTKAGAHNNDNFQIPLANTGLIYNVAELGWIHMFGFSKQDDGDFPQRLDKLREDRRFLDFSTTAVVPETGIPHAAMVMDQFTTLHPRHDGVDNDNRNGTDDIGEQFIPGQININTAPQLVQFYAMPLPEDAKEEIRPLMYAVVQYRDEPAPANRLWLTGLVNGENGKLRTNPGIASIGELMFINPATDPSQSALMNMQRYTIDRQPDNVDLYPSPRPGDPAAEHYRFVSTQANPEAEARMARFQFLTNVLTTRSDVYCAYVVIRGYQDFSEQPVEGKHFFVLYDRSDIRSAGQAAKVLGVYAMP